MNDHSMAGLKSEAVILSDGEGQQVGDNADNPRSSQDLADGVFGSAALKGLNLSKKANARSTVNIKNNRVAVKSYGRRSLANVNMLSKRS